MVSNNKMIVGFLMVAVLSTATYVTLLDDVRLRVDNDKSTFYILNDNNRWEVSGREYNSLFSGSTKLNRRSSGIQVDTTIKDNKVVITRYTPLIRGPVIVDTYEFDGMIDDVTQFPISHSVRVINGSGFFYRYEVRELEYVGPTNRKATSPQEFGKNMKIEWDMDRQRWAHVYQSGILKVQYKILSDDETYQVRLFDPPNNKGIQINCIGEVKSIIGQSIKITPASQFNNGTTLDREDVVLEYGTVCVKYEYLLVKGNDFINLSNIDYECSQTSDGVVCDSKLDGNGYGVCDSGESCILYDLKNSLTISENEGYRKDKLKVKEK